MYATFIVDGNAPIWNQQFLGPSADTQDAFILRKSCLNNVCGKCIDLARGDITNGNKILLWDCNGKDSQLWVYDGLYIRYCGAASEQRATRPLERVPPAPHRGG